MKAEQLADKNRFSIALSTPKTQNKLECIESKIIKDKNKENTSKLYLPKPLSSTVILSAMAINKNQEFPITFYDLDSLENSLIKSQQHQHL